MQFRVATAVGALALVSLSCRDAVAPVKGFGTVGVSVSVEGIDAPEAIGISIDGANARQVVIQTTTWFFSLQPGRHVVTAREVPENCSLDAGNSVTVDVAGDGTATAAFRMRCLSASGSISVAVSVAGRTTPTWIAIAIDNVVQPAVRGNDKVVFDRYPGGQHKVTAMVPPAGCALTSINPQLIQLVVGRPNRDTAAVKFDLTCDPRTVEPDADRRIAFQRDGVVMLTGEDGRNPVQLIAGLTPSWSPDGRSLVYGKPHCESWWGCDDEIWIIGEDGSAPHAVTSGTGGMDYDPAISPDGRRIAFIRFIFGPDYEQLVTTNLDGGSPQRLSDWYPLSRPTWSPGSDRIAFTCENGPGMAGFGVCIISASPSCPETNLYACPSIEHLNIGAIRSSDPAWSPDGSLIAFTIGCSRMFCGTSQEADSSEIALFNLKTRTITKLSSGHTPAWSPDGTRLVFAGNSDRPGLQIINIDGSGLTRITTNGNDTAPSWR